MIQKTTSESPIDQGHASILVDAQLVTRASTSEHALEAPVQVHLVRESIASEIPIAFNYNGINHLVLMATPQDLADLALGFSLSEGVIDQAADLYDVEIVHADAGISLELDISSRCFERLKEQRRLLVGRTGCGLCGLESLQAFQARQTLTGLGSKSSLLGQLSDAKNVVAASAVQRTLAQLAAHQTLFEATGGTHAAAFGNQHGDIVMCREDVGRHNALDKLLGGLIQHSAPVDLASGFVVMSSRASYELIHKCAVLGIGCLVTVSAPTSLAVERAQSAGLCLIGFARDARMTVYTHPQRVDVLN